MIVAGSGHRPKYCPCLYDNSHAWLQDLKNSVSIALAYEMSFEHTIDAVITGCAIGWDTWFAEEAMRLKLPVHAYVPFKGQGSKWPEESRKKYEEILEYAEVVKYISKDYSKDAFLKRDRAMIDDCDEVYALLNPEVTSGGTYYTVRYAKTLNKPIQNFWR